MDVTASPRHDGSPSAPLQARDGDQNAAPHAPRSAAVRTVVTILLAAFSGAAAGALVAHHGRTASTDSDGAPRVLSHLASTDAAGIAAAVAPAVVSIRTRAANISNLFDPAPAAGQGTGIVIRSDGTIVTDENLVAGPQAVTVTLADGRAMAARIVGRDPASGIAVLKVPATGLPTARLADSDDLRVGDDVVALGDALALPGGPTVSRGVVAALQRSVAMPSNSAASRLTGLLEVTNALGATNAGGPVVDADGDVVGIGVAAQNGDRPPGFAIDVAHTRSVIDALEHGDTLTNALGADAIDVTPLLAREYDLPVESGALIASVEPGSAAQRAGLKPDDIVVEFANERIATAADLARRMLDPSVTTVRLAVLRGKTPLTLTVHLTH